MMEIAVASLDEPDVRQLVTVHQRRAFELSPPGTSFALTPDELRRPEITLFALREAGLLLGIGALLELDPASGEIKSMRTADEALRRGVGGAVLGHIETVARQRGYQRLLLETGNSADYAPANRLYQRHGFARCEPFASYEASAFNIFYEKPLI